LTQSPAVLGASHLKLAKFVPVRHGLTWSPYSDARH
jgi:hypothetical protein